MSEKVLHLKKRIISSLLTVVILAGIFIPTASAYAASQQVAEMQASLGVNAHKGAAPDISTKMKENYPAGEQPTDSGSHAAADAKPQNSSLLAKLGKNSSPQEAAIHDITKQPKITPHELTDLRDATTSVSVNSDGTLTQKKYFTPKFFKKDNAWQNIDTTLIEDTNAGDASNAVTKALGLLESAVSSPTNFVSKDNDWQARFSPSGSSSGMVRIKKGSSQIGFSPVGAKDIAPVITTNNDGQQTVHYYDLWPGVNVDYIVESNAVKENVILKDKNATASVSFKMIGGGLEKHQGDDKSAPTIGITGALDNQFAIAPANLILNNFGLVTDNGVFNQDFKGDTITLSVDKTYLAGLPDKAFPAVVDPGVFYSNAGTRAGGNYMAFKSDGYVCYSNVCNIYAGSLFDSTNTLRYWRGALFAPYDQFRTAGTNFISASLHLLQRSNESFWTGTWDTHTYYVGHAACLNGFNCLENGAFNAAGAVGGSGDINVTNIYQAMISRGDFGAWLMIGGEDGTTSSYKNFDPGNGGTSGSYVAFTYGGPPAAPAISTPVTNQVYVDPQASFRVDYEVNPNGSTPLKYEILVSTAAGGSGAFMSSGLLDSQQWTIADGILQDGSTYYVQARSYDPITGTFSTWGNSVPFKIDTRTGNNKTQTYDSMGPISVDLATGNVTTSASSHSSASLGGAMGISMTYNSPLKSRKGLVGQYWNNQTMSGSPTLTRIDQNIDFSWDLGSPSAGTIPNDSFSSKWTGYFVAPTTGDYYFGGVNDDYMTVTVNGQQAYNSTLCGSTPCYGTTAIHLNIGQVVPFLTTQVEIGGYAQAHVYVKGAVGEQVIPSDWLQTGARPLANKQGLTGSYFFDDGTHNFSANNTMFMQRTDSLINFNWGIGSPVTGGPSDNFLVRWSGYFTPPTTDTYVFSANSDDGVRITVGTNATNGNVLNQWMDQSGNSVPGNPVNLTQNVAVPITVEYYEHTGGANIALSVKVGSGASQIVPSAWLSAKAQVLPDGWNLGIDADGSVAYERIKVNQASAVLTDSSGATHEYKAKLDANGNFLGGYTPPVNEDGQLIRNADGSFTLQDTDGKTYVFATDGTLSSMTSSTDDRKPAALKYTYASVNGGPPTLTQITDAADPSRTATVFYSGNSNCGAAPAGFDASAPANMLCAFKTSDGRFTYFYYTAGQLARIAQPGNALTDYFYESVNDVNNNPVGYRLSGMRDTLANDAIAAGVRANDDTTKTKFTYDILSRATRIMQPAPTDGGPRTEHSIEYLPGALDKSYYGATQQHITSASEPSGFSRRVEYDSLFRVSKDINNLNLATLTEWDPAKDLIYSTTDPLGMKSTNIYDDQDRPVTGYGPAPAAWFSTADPKNQTPLAANAAQVPRSDAGYDEGIVGPSVAWFDYTKQPGNTSGVLYGAPKLHTTGINTSSPGTLSYDFASPPITASSSQTVPNIQGIGLSATGQLRLPIGTYTINADTSDGIRVWVDDQLVVDQWSDSAYRTVTSNNFTISTAAPKRFRIDTYRKTGSTGMLNVRIQQSGGFTYTTNWSTYLKPDYGLPTSSKIYDTQLGNITAATGYGSTPELALAQTATTDPNGLNLSATSTYEAQGIAGGFLRRTSQSLPGNPANNPSFSYSYYGATETRTNPCVANSPAVSQAGFLKFKTEADPDGAGPQTGRITETVYDAAGRVVASRYNTDGWTCATFDARGRATQTTVPAFNGQAARTIQSDYAVGGNPLETTTWDGNGWVVTWVDLLGRTVRYRDVHDDETLTTYDNIGRITQKVTPIGTLAFTYDTYSRMTTESLDTTVYASITYDQFGRVDHINYPNAGQLKATPGRDVLGRGNSISYVMGDGVTTVSDTVTRSQSGRVQNDTVQSGGNQLYSSYSYDGAGRLVGATTGPHNYSYGFGTQSSTCGTGNNMNPNAGKNGNRTTQTIDGVTTTYCYDYADRLVSSSDPTANYTEYDSHGNMTYIGTGTTPLRMCYDVSDRNTCLVSYDASGNGTALYYGRDVTGRIIYRERDNVSAWNWTTNNAEWYGYIGDGEGTSFVRNSAWAIVEENLTLPGGVTMSIKPQQTGNNQKTYSFASVLGRTLLTANAAGANTSNGNGPLNTFTYDPFGNIIPGSNNPSNGTDVSYGFGGPAHRSTEMLLALQPIQMGARVYLPTLGRFTSVDSVVGGTANNYVYVLDPINSNDYSGQFSIGGAVNWVKKHVIPVVVAVVAIVAVGIILASNAEVVMAAATAVASAVTAAAAAVTRAASAVSSFVGRIAPASSGGIEKVETALPEAHVEEFKSSLELGQEAHKAFSAVVEGEGGIANRAVFEGSNVRPDGYFPTLNKIIELKPDNLRGIQQGLNQLNGYSNLAPDGSSSELWLYNLNADGSFNFFQYNP